MSFLYTVQGLRKTTPDEKRDIMEANRDFEAKLNAHSEESDKATIKEIRSRNPHLFK